MINRELWSDLSDYEYAVVKSTNHLTLTPDCRSFRVRIKIGKKGYCRAFKNVDDAVQFLRDLHMETRKDESKNECI